MKLLKKVSAVLVTGFGSVCVLAGIYAPFNPDISRQEKIEEATACLLIGVPLTGWGLWIWRGLARQRDKEVQDRLQSIFYRLIQQENGEITVLRFAMEAQLPGKEAKKYLDEKAKEFLANFDVTETGDISYRFDL
ncbi:hypothetical protein [Argonema galeatum]|uniref:hypothetical protein n=1 Tax=Argonema galeatum TaxID=2942762 RepID=UPI002013899F|nr:hypothetical protein [Argonema galeatum]MCL1467524.1 hypothetical protein [Argonema galeatum A003/A1]